MVMRIWRATGTIEGAAAYRDLFERSILPRLRSLTGFQKAYLLNRPHDGTVEIEVHTLWDSAESILAFAGADIDAAVVGPDVQATVTSFETTAPHFQVVEYGG